MRMDRFYEERVFSGLITAIIGAVSAAMLGAFFYQRLVGPVGTRPAPDWFLLAIALFLLVVTINFAVLTIRVTSRGVSVSYGVIRHEIAWSNMADCYQDSASSVRYGGFGIRLGLVDGRRRLIYNTIGDPRVVVRKRQGNIQEFVFSTRNPQGVITAIREGLRQRG